MTIRVGLLGAGYMAGEHGTRLATLPDVEIAAICALAGREEMSERLTDGTAEVFEDFDRMLDAVDLDALYVCIPPFAHSGQEEKAAAAGIHLFMEKPIAIDAERAESIVNAIEAAGVVSQVGYMSRFGAAVRKLKAMIEDGSAGRPTLYQGRFFCNALHSPWWRAVAKSGGQVLEQVIHQYDLAMHLMGEPETVCGFADNLCHEDVEEYTVEDTSVSAIRFKGGAVGSIVGSNCAVPGEWTADCRVVCENVTVLFEDVNSAEFVYTNEEPVRREAVTEEVDPIMEETKNFLAAVRGECEPLAPARDGLTGVKLTSAVLKSSAEGGLPVRIGTEV